jgi:hypothetical protein
MTKATYATPSLSRTSRAAGYVTGLAAALALLLLLILHIVRSDLAPQWHMVSQYAVGDYGWLQTLVFAVLALGCVANFVTVRTQVGTIAGKIGLVFLLAAAVGLTMAALFNWVHPLHAVASFIGVPGFTVGALLIGISLARNEAWVPARRRLLIWSHLSWIALVLLMIAIFTTVPPSGEFDPGTLVGWPNRLQFLAWGGWLIVTSWQAIAVSKPAGQPAR